MRADVKIGCSAPLTIAAFTFARYYAGNASHGTPTSRRLTGKSINAWREVALAWRLPERTRCFGMK
ncbi:hypothetical protein [Paraburkholderia unamae]|uniref:hypothetical protein n=1 Tax=Paraburkholderia unamae TaxID=219649 RepID=UPI001CC430A6|nr:hypothetical protein [Paraburkholderia unamae]